MGYSLADIGCWCFNGVYGLRSREETMIQPVILEKLAELPESLQTEVLHYIEFLIEKQAKNSTQEKPTKKRRVAGTMKGMFVLPLPDDFDEPLEDMKEYME
ncbi:type II toxin-antitoxin system VapB family antitoxin [Microcoleus sp. K4-B3]|uniref:type II toxin-antitoxin system VapB family antitoxin n=1 Tax=Microcoleus sp. K4-B3 TaxID=2818791 RepID=UPI002FD5E7A9